VGLAGGCGQEGAGKHLGIAVHLAPFVRSEGGINDMALHKNTRLGRKDLPDTNTQTFVNYDNEKSFITIAPDVNVIKLFLVLG
jgi:hypothetical protein